MRQNAAFGKIGRILLCVAAGLGLFWVLESGIDRRIGFDLFLPALEKQLQPGRVSRLGAMLVICFALAMTERGRKLRAAVNGACRKDWVCWLAAFIVTGLFFLWTWRVTVVSFMTNDDTAIMKSIGRIPTQGLQAASTFSHILFCAMLSLFYRLAPGGYWYAWYHLAAINLSLVIMGRCICLKTGKRGWPLGAGLAIYLLLCGGVFLYTISQLSFTVTPAIVGSAAVTLILCRSDTEGKIGHIFMDVGSVLLMLLCCLQRSATGKCLLCFWALAVGYQLLKLVLDRRPGLWRRILPLSACALVTLGLYFGIGSITVRSLDETAEITPGYATAEHYRSLVMDYLIDDLTNEQLEEAGLPSELSTLLRMWYFMDERINTDTFRTIVDMYYTASPAETESSAPSKSALSSALSDESDEDIARMRCLTAALCLLLLLSMAAFAHCGRRYWPEALCALCATGGAALLCSYLIIKGRFPLRVFLVVAIPALVTLLLMVLSVPTSGIKAGKRPALTVCSGLLIAGLCVISALMVRSAPYTRSSVTRADVFYTQQITEDYANTHPDIYFVTNFTSNNLDPFHDVRSYPSNMGLWGGTGVTASTNRRYADYFFRDDVQFMYEQASTIIPLLQYLTLDNGPVQALTLAQLSNGIYVVDISQVSPGDAYTGWYEQNGMTYYFIDGEAVTGMQVINGTEYTFAPAGADAMPAIAPTGLGGALYSTDAYSLIAGE